MRKCLFCDENANSREDVWPLWITEQFRSDTPIPVEARRKEVTLKPWKTLQPELVVRAICETCNSGWMSDLETRVKPHLQPLIDGSTKVVSDEAQMIISLWAMKTAMALEGMDNHGDRGYSAEDRRMLRRQSAIPWRTCVWLAVSADAQHVFSAKSRYKDSANDPIPRAVCTTMVFGHIALQVLTIRVPEDVGPHTGVTTDVRDGPWEQVTRKIWPGDRTAMRWPPERGLNGIDGLDLFAERFSTSNAEPRSLRTMAV